MMSPPNPSQAKNSTKPITSQVVRRRLASCCWKRLPSGEVNLRHRALGLILDLPQVRRSGVSEAGHERRRKLLLLGVVERRRVVVELPGERDSVLGGRQLFLELADVASRLELGIALDRHEQARQGARERVLRLADLF